MNRLRSVKLEGSIDVGSRKIGKLFLCNALQFDIVGTGATKHEAFVQLKELLEDYILAIVKSLGDEKKVRFFNPAEDDEWNNAKQLEFYDVTFIVEFLPKNGDLPVEVKVGNMAKLTPYWKAIRAVDLIPA
jgi:hypothetical protein